MIRLPRAVLLLVTNLILLQCVSGLPQAPASSDESPSSLSEVRDKHRALLIVFRSSVLDASDNERAIIDQVLKADPLPKGRCNRPQFSPALSDYKMTRAAYQRIRLGRNVYVTSRLHHYVFLELYFLLAVVPWWRGSTRSIND